MLSDSCNISEFLNKTKDKNYQGILMLANQEVTAVERCLYKKKCAPQADSRMREYAATLKDFIDFMRFGVKTRSVSKLDLHYFSGLRQMR